MVMIKICSFDHKYLEISTVVMSFMIKNVDCMTMTLGRKPNGQKIMVAFTQSRTRTLIVMIELTLFNSMIETYLIDSRSVDQCSAYWNSVLLKSKKVATEVSLAR